MQRQPQFPWHPDAPVCITPGEFEEQVLSWLTGAAGGLATVHAERQGRITGPGGEYAIDVLIEFEVFDGATITILVECKHQKRPVERDEVIVLEGKVRDVRAHKGMLFSTSGFQRGALQYASAQGIATVTVVDGRWVYETRGFGPSPEPPPWVHLHTLAGIRLTPIEESIAWHSFDDGSPDALRDWLQTTGLAQ